MGSALHTLDSLVYFQVWTASEVARVQEALRRRKAVMSLDKTHFSRFFAAQSPELVKVFDAMDTDFDGKVDTFEILLIVVLWSNATWEEKLQLLFTCFDFNAKGFLRFAELFFMLSTASKVLRKFAQLEPDLEDPAALREAALGAFGGEQGGELAADGFNRWFEESNLAQKLRVFVDENASASVPEVVEAPMRQSVRMLEYNTQELAQKIEHLKQSTAILDAEEVQRGTQQQQQFDVLRRSLERTLNKLTLALETIQSEVAELVGSLNDTTAGAGAVGLVAPQAKQKHELLHREIEVLRRQCVQDHEGASEILGRLIELTFGLPPPTPEPLPDGGQRPVSKEAAAEERASVNDRFAKVSDPEADKRRLRLLDRELRRKAGKKPAQSSVTVAEDGTIVELDPMQLQVPPIEAGQAEARDSPSPELAQAAAEPEVQRLLPGEALPTEDFPDGDVDEGEEDLPVVVAFADFDPPDSHDTQMLVLRVGDEIVATGQDGQGWWYGKKKDGSEGWFPPSYVQLRDEVPEGAG